MAKEDLFKKYAAVPLKSIKESVAEDNSKTDRQRSDRLDIQDGLNRIRIYPKHEGEKSWMALFCSRWVTLINDKGEESRRTVADGKIHGHLSSDPIEAYIQFVKDNLDTDDPNNAKIITTLTTYPNGMHMGNSYLAYASVVKKIDGKLTLTPKVELFEMKRSIRDGLIDATVTEEEDDAIVPDPYTDPLTGKCALITYNSSAKAAKDKYKVQVSDKATPLTIELLEAFDKLTPLSKLSHFNYTDRDFDTAVQGIQFFDEKNGLDLFDTDEFQVILKGLRKELKGGAATKVTSADEDDTDEDDDDDKPAAKAPATKAKAPAAPAPKATAKANAAKKSAPVELDEEENELPWKEGEDDDDDDEDTQVKSSKADQFEGMSRDELKQFIGENSLQDAFKTEQGDRKLKAMSDDDIRAVIRKIYAPAATPAEDVDTDDTDEDDDEEEVSAPPPPVKKKVAAAETPKKGGVSLDDIKARLKKK